MRRLALSSLPAFPLVLLVSVACPGTARAAPIDAVTAREQLKQGYALKKEGRCADAVPHLVESERLDPQSKTLLNLAECEDSLGHLVAAEAHLLEARDRARTEKRPELEGIANQRLDVVDRRVPRLAVTLAPGAPPGTQVFRDGTLLGDVSLGVALPVDPGTHELQATAEGVGSRHFQVTLKESETQKLAVSPVEPAAPAPPAPPPTAAVSDAGGASHVPAIVAFGVGGAGLVVGTIFAVRAFGKWSDAKSECTSVAATCAPGSASASSTSSARTSATVSDVGFIAGGVGVAAGVVLLLLESRSSTDALSASATGARSWWFDPQVGTTGGSLSVGGRF